MPPTGVVCLDTAPLIYSVENQSEKKQMSEKQNPHDQFFKETLAQPAAAADFLRYYLPERVVSLIEPETAERVEDSFVDEDLKEHLSDLLFRVRLKNKGDLFIYILLEHKSFPDKWVALQLLRYLVRIWEKAQREGVKKLPPVVPVMFYHGRAEWKISVHFSSLFELTTPAALREYVPEFNYHLCDLANLSNQELRGEATFQAAMIVLKHIFRVDLPENLREVFDLASEDETLERLRVIINYLTQSKRVTEEQVGNVLREIRRAEEMETIFDKLIARGEKQGLRQGLRQGRQETILEITLLQLKKRFGELDAETESQIRGLTVKKLEKLSEALLDFEQRADLTKWMEKNAANKTS